MKKEETKASKLMWLKKDVHLRLKLYAANEDTTLGGAVEKLLDNTERGVDDKQPEKAPGHW